MTDRRTTLAAVLLSVAAGTAASAVVLHHGLTAEYGDVAAPFSEAVLRGPATGLVGTGLLGVVLLGAVSVVLAPARWVRVTAVLLPVATLVGVLAATPPALERKIEEQYTPAPVCLGPGGAAPGPSPGRREARASQRAYDSVDHVGLFHGGGGSGVGGCDRGFVLTDEADALAHYRRALPDAGWRVVEDRDDRLRAEQGRAAIEVVLCDGGGRLWAGRRGLDPRTGCDDDPTVAERS